MKQSDFPATAFFQPQSTCACIILGLLLQWDGSEAPRLLERAAASSSSPAASAAGPVVKKIAKYSWGDETEKVNAHHYSS
jgi:hypothetical protein